MSFQSLNEAHEAGRRVLGYPLKGSVEEGEVAMRAHAMVGVLNGWAGSLEELVRNKLACPLCGDAKGRMYLISKCCHRACQQCILNRIGHEDEPVVCPKTSGREVVDGELKDVEPHPLTLPLPIDRINAAAERFVPGVMPNPVNLSIFVD